MATGAWLSVSTAAPKRAEWQQEMDTTADQSNSTYNSLQVEDVDSGENYEEREGTSHGTRRVLLGIKALISILLFVIVLGCTTLSKLTLVSMTDQLHYLSMEVDKTKDNVHKKQLKSQVVTLYWQLFFVMVLPNLFTVGRTFIFGVFGKTKKSFPWPTPKAALLGIFLSVVEVVLMSSFVFLVLGYLPPQISIPLMNGVFLGQIALDVFRTPWKPPDQSRGSYRSIDQEGSNTSKLDRVKFIFGKILENKPVKGVALLLQVAGIVGLVVYLVVEHDHAEFLEWYLRPIIAFPIVLLAMSIIWSDKIQVFLAHTTRRVDETHTARYKSCFINSIVRVLLYPFVSYIVFRYATSHHIDPWCLDSDNCDIDFTWTGESLAVFLVQILASFFAYIFVWIACTMTLEWCGMALPLLLSTPVSLLWYYLDAAVNHTQVFPFYTPHNDSFPLASAIAGSLWISQVLAMGYYIWIHSNVILARDMDMFVSPHYDGVFLEQQLILNRQIDKNVKSPNEPRGITAKRPPRTVFICSTMFRETDTEMRQMLNSIYRVACHQDTWKLNHPGEEGDQFESHIFFDGALNGTQLTHFALQLVSLLHDTLKVDLKACRRQETPYGHRLSWYINDSMPFSVHMKDNIKVKNKKRWSQIMYMNYVINQRIKTDGLLPENTFILTTDADIDFTADSAMVLLDMLASNPKVAAVCARTHPKGSGPLYWYQVFDYAIGHWFLKPAEHILGCVLCCPGCFSVFRCKALMDTLETYSSEVTGANEFLTMDMGEDRWLCTLLIQHGWRLEYCAISEDYTFCPESFDEFFKQRRRWIPSTVANLSLLISEAGSITSGNDTVSMLFVFFQAILVFSTAISPATVILLIASGLGSGYDLSESAQLAVIVLLSLASFAYGVICLYTSQQTQLDVAKLLTLIFSIIMAVVIAGVFKGTVNDIIKSTTHIKASLLVNVTAPATDDVFKFPVSITTMYTAILAFTFIIAALLHPPEWTCLLHFIWYLLALPSGYLLLLIYSAANLDSQSWGTREAKSGTQGGYNLLVSFLKQAWGKILQCFTLCCGGKKETKAKETPNEPLQEVPPPGPLPPPPPPGKKDWVAPSVSGDSHRVPVEHKKMDSKAQRWLEDLECKNYIPNFEEHGYVNEHFLASMKKEDFVAVGVEKRGFVLRLEKAARKLPSLPIDTDVPQSVVEWLQRLELDEYTELFHAEGYRTEDDIENLKELTQERFVAMGIHKRAHLQRLKAAINFLFYPRAVELQIRKTKGVIENIQITQLASEEETFWKKVIHHKLKPVRVRLTQFDELKTSLRSLRNVILAVLLLINLMWIILLYELTFDVLDQYNLPTRAFSLLFLAVYGVVLIIQLFALICHRVVTLVHYLGRVKTESIATVSEDPLLVTMRENLAIT